MRKILFILLLMLVSIGCYSQKLVKGEYAYDRYGRVHWKIQVYNSQPYTSIVSATFLIIYEEPGKYRTGLEDVTDDTYKEHKLDDVTIPPKSTGVYSFSDTCPDRTIPVLIKLRRVIFNNGTCKIY